MDRLHGTTLFSLGSIMAALLPLSVAAQTTPILPFSLFGPHYSQDARPHWDDYRDLTGCFFCNRSFFLQLPGKAILFVTSYLYGLFFCAPTSGGRFGEFFRSAASTQLLVRKDTVDVHHFGKTRRTNPPWITKTLRTNPPWFGKKHDE